MASTEAGKTAHLRFEGELTVKRAAEIREKLMMSLNAFQRIEIELDKVTKIDLSCLQLLCSAHRSAVAGGKALKVEKPDGVIFTEIKRRAGFSAGTKCPFNRQNNCVWLEG